MGGGFFKKCAFFAFSKVEIHNACKHLFLKMGGGIFKKCAFFAFSKVEIHIACKHLLLKMGGLEVSKNACIFRIFESRNSQCLRTLVFENGRRKFQKMPADFSHFRKVEVHNLPVNIYFFGNGRRSFQKMPAFFAFSKVEIHNLPVNINF